MYSVEFKEAITQYLNIMPLMTSSKGPAIPGLGLSNFSLVFLQGGFFEMSEKVWGHVTGQGEFENRGQEPQGHPKRAQKILEK